MINELIAICAKENVLTDESLKKYTTFGTGGNAKAVIIPDTPEKLTEVVKTLKGNCIIIGNGSNILAPDEGIEKFVVVTKKLNSITLQDNKIYSGCGVMMSKLANVAMENSLSGLEFASGIPGTVGGGIFMNAGAYDGVISGVIEYADCLDENNKLCRLFADQLKFAYRHSIFMERKLVILGGSFTLKNGKKQQIASKMNEFNERRRSKQPLEFKSAGSTFKRPEGYFAGKLIEDCGLKGYRVNDAQVSEKHAGFVINRGNASTSDILAVIDHCRQVVYKKYNVILEPEIKILRND